RHQPDKIPSRHAHQVGQNLVLALQHHFVDRAGPLGHHRRDHHYGLVSTHGPFSVTAIQCSKCAELEPSFVTAVHLSFNTTASGFPAFTIGSTARTIPGFSFGFSFFRST